MQRAQVQITHMTPIDLQETNERRYSRKHINGYIDLAIRENPDNEAKVVKGIDLLTQWLNTDHYPAKNARLQQLDVLCVEQIVRDVFINIAYCRAEELFVSVSGQLASNMGFADHRDSILTMAEVIAVLCNTDAYDITKATKEASLMVKNRLTLPPELLDAMDRSLHIPPMVCPPLEVKSNYESPYLTFNEPLVLGKHNNHAGDLCLDIINMQNNIALSLNTEFLSTVEEEPTHTLDTQEKVEQWNTFKKHSYEIYQMLHKQGNQFWVANRPDKRGRLYAQGYHVNPQGTPFKKAMLELHKQELVQGVPT